MIKNIRIGRLVVHLDVVRGVDYFGKAAHGSVIHNHVRRQTDRQTDRQSIMIKNIRV